MAVHFGKFLREKVIAANRGTPTSFHGCTSEQIERLLIAQGVGCLPKVYIEFMEVMGHQAGNGFLIGEDYYYKIVIRMKQLAQEAIDDLADYDPSQAFHLPDDVFVFFGHHGIQYYYFHTTDCNDDPPVFLWFEGRGNPKQVANTLSEFFLSELQR